MQVNHPTDGGLFKEKWSIHLFIRNCTEDLRRISTILYDYAGILGPPPPPADAHIVPIHLSRQMESCFVAKEERVWETVNCKSLLHFNAEIKTHIFVIFAEILMQRKTVGFTL